MCVQWSEAAIGSSLLWLLGSISDQLSPLYGNQPQWCSNPTAPTSHPPTFLACLQMSGAAEATRSLRLPSLRQHQSEGRQQVGPRGSDRWEAPPCPRPAACSPVAAVMSLRHLHSAAGVSSGHAHYHSMCYLWELVRSPGGWRGVGERLCNTADCTLPWSDKCTGC